MTIDNALNFFESLLKKTDKKSEIKIYKYFIVILSDLKDRELTEEQFQSIEVALETLDLKSNPENKKKYFSKKLAEFKAFLKNEFSFTTEKYYTEIGMVYGMMFGSGIGLSIGTGLGTAFGGSTGMIIGMTIGLSIGTGIGMVFGMMFGARKDAEAKRHGRVI